MATIEKVRKKLNPTMRAACPQRGGIVGIALFCQHWLNSSRNRSRDMPAVRMLAAPLWGRAIDRHGARPVLICCSFGISVVPAIWLFPTPERLWPIAVEAVISGFLWGGHGIAALDLSIGLAPRTGRPFYLAAFATAGGIGFGIASVLAGQLATLAPAHFVLAGYGWTSIHILFFLSSLGRLVSAGLAERVPYRGVRVREMSTKDVVEAYGLRLVLEAVIAQEAAKPARASGPLIRVVARDPHGGAARQRQGPIGRNVGRGGADP